MVGLLSVHESFRSAQNGNEGAFMRRFEPDKVPRIKPSDLITIYLPTSLRGCVSCIITPLSRPSLRLMQLIDP